MGFMDKAKQLAEQAQQKLEETQKQFNDNQAAKAGQQGGGSAAVRYDEHGRPIADPGQPAAAPAPVPTEAAPGEAPPAPAAPADSPAADAPAPPAPPPASGDDANANPDPFKPIE